MPTATAMTYLLWAGGAVYAMVCARSLAGHLRRRPRRTGETPTVSVIVPVRNEEARIGGLLDDLTAQDYPKDKLEIVVVDDQSTDGTAAVVRDAASRDSRIRLETTAGADLPYTHKKGAVYRGIASSHGDIIMTVDGDARVKPGWVRSKADCFADDIDLVAGDVTIEGGGLMGQIEALEMVALQTVTAGLMNLGLPVTCNGANLAYRRTAFERVGGFGDTGRFISGDDDMLMQKIAAGNPRRVVYIPGPNDAVATEAVTSVGEFLSRRARWASKLIGYPSLAAKVMLAAIGIFIVMALVWAILAMVGLAAPGPILIMLGLKALTDLMVCVFAVVRFKRPGLLAAFPLAEILHIPYIIGVSVRGMFGTFEWRGRRVSAAAGTECGDCVHG